MLADTRRVHRLVLASAAACVRRGAFLIEDALRTAALPGSERQLILVRSLALGRIDARESPVALSRRIQRKWHELARYAVPASSPDTTFAPAVTFPSREHAFAVYLAALLRGDRRNEWFWRCVLPPRCEIQPAAGLFVTMVRACAAAQDGNALRILDFLGELERFEALPLLIEVLEAKHVGEVWALTFPGGDLRALAETHLHAEKVEAVPVPPVYRRILERLLAQHSADRTVVTWIAAMAVLAVRPRMISSPEEVFALAGQLEQSLQPARHARMPDAEPGARAKSESPAVEAAGPALIADARVEPPSPPTGLRDVSPRMQESAEEAGVVVPVAADLTQNTPETWITYAGGLFFVLPVLGRLGFDFTNFELLPALLFNIARSAQISPADPILEAVGESLSHPAIRHWRRRVRRYLRANIRTSLRRVVRREAQVVVTRTHVDVFFALEHADIRIRRHGLDINPGWVPALGKVIAYHYGDD